MHGAPSAGKETLLAAVRAAVEAAAGERISLSKFLASSGFKRRDIFKYYDRWPQVLRAAGFKFKPYNRRIDDSLLFADWAAVVLKLGRPPTQRQYAGHGKYSCAVIKLRAGSWGRVPDAFRVFAGPSPRWKDVLSLLPDASTPSIAESRKAVFPVSARNARKFPVLLNGRPLRGAPLGIGSLLYAPLNEMGVIYLFAILAADLGFHAEALQPGYPDCEARRLVATGTWQTVRIEFEYESRSFRDHGHPPEDCDIIVCWAHNWDECPKNLEVIELRKEVKRFLGRA